MNNLEQEVLKAALDDYVDLWNIQRLIAGKEPHLKEDRVREEVLGTLEALLSKGALLAGDLVVGNETTLVGSAGYELPLSTFRHWDDQDAQAVVRIVRQRWASLGKPLNVGDVAWFEITKKGEALAGRSP